MTGSVFPLERTVEEPDGSPDLVSFEDADAVFEALASGTARRIVGALRDTPATPSELAERADTSIQNVTYHLDQLQAAGLVDVVGTWYSSRGVEMDVYGPADDPVVVCLGDDEDQRRVASRLSGTDQARAFGDAD